MIKIDPEIASTMSKDDIPFMKKENLRKPKEDDEILNFIIAIFNF
jgi:hypothetical protein